MLNGISVWPLKGRFLTPLNLFIMKSSDGAAGFGVRKQRIVGLTSLIRHPVLWFPSGGATGDQTTAKTELCV